MLADPGGAAPSAVWHDPTTTIVLHGALAKRYGRRHELGVRSATEAAYALCQLHPGFRADFEAGHYKVIRGSVKNGLPLSEGMLAMRIGAAGELHFVPAAAGSKNGGVGKAILGAVIVVAAVAASIPSGGSSIALGATAPSVGGASITFGQIAMFGASLLLSGISSIISPQPKNNSNQTDPRSSFGLTGAMNSTAEGSVIPVVYGRQRVGSVVGSFSYSAEDYVAPGDPQPVPAPTDPFLGGGSGALGSGGGGKGGSSGGGASEAPNTLRSNAVVRVIDILSEGPIGGLVDGPKSIFFNGTPLMASDGSYNFQGVSYEVRLGYPDQGVVQGFPAAEQTLSSELGLPYQVKKLQPKTVTVTSSTATAARVTVRLPTLVTQDPKTGNLKAGPDLDFLIEVRRANGAWTTAKAEHITGQKCVSPYQRSYRFDLPGATDAANRATTWDIRMTRSSVDDADSSTHSETYFDSVGLITDHQVTYSNTAFIALTIDASAFGSQIPTRQYDIDGILCAVPLNYDPVGHSYATTGPGTTGGTWNGASWKTASTSNPAWCLYDMLSSGRYGMGLPPAVLVATRLDLYPISQYCDGRVPSGFKDDQGNDPGELRYALNVNMTTQEDAYRVIQSMSSAFRGMSYWGAGRVVVSADMPVQPSSVLNQTNVTNGEFSYEGTALNQRHTVARVAWQDPDNSYKTAIEVVEDFDAVVANGQVPVDLHAFGCTSRGLAHRLGKWLLDTERTQNETVHCTTSLEQLRVRPGDVVLLHDPAFVGQVMAGRCAASSTTTTILLDRVLSAPSDLTYKLAVTLPDGTVDYKQVASIATAAGVNNGNSVVTMQQALSLPPDVHATWILSSNGTPGPHGAAGVFAVEPRQFRILGLTEPHRGVFNVAGVNHDPNKYARVEYGLQFDPTPYSALGELLATPLPVPTNVFARDYITGVGTTTLVRVTVSCTASSDPRVVGIQYRAAGPEQRIEPDSSASHDFDGLQLGTYVFSARSIGRDGRASEWADSDPVVVDGLADPPPAVTGLTAQGGAMFVDISLNNSTARDLLHYELWRAPAPNNGVHPFQFAAFAPTGTPASNGATLLATFAGTRYHDTGDVLGPDKAWAYWVRPVNTTLVPGAFAGPVKALTTYYLTDNLEEAIRNTAVYAQALLGGAPPVVNDLSVPGTTEGQRVFNRTDQVLYSWDSAHQQWVRYIALVPDSTGKLTAAQIGALTNVQIQGNLTPEQTAALIAGLGAASITSDKIASVVGTKITGAITNATMAAGQIYDVDPVTGNSVPGVSAAKLLGPLQASKIVDQDGLGNIIPGVASNRIVGAIPTSQLTGNILAAAGVILNLASAQIQGVLAAANTAALQALSGQVTSVQISDSAITAPKIKAGELVARMVGADLVQAANIGAGAVTTAALAVGSPNNSIANSCFAYGADGWTGLLPTPVIGTSDEANYGLSGLGAGRFNAGVLVAGGSVDTTFTNGASGTGRAFDASIPAAPGECWEAQVAYIPIGGALEVYLVGVNASGVLLTGPSSGPVTFTPPANGKVLSSWQTFGVRGVMPSGTVAVGILLRWRNTSGISANVAGFVTRCLLGKTVPNATTLLPWTPGGVTLVTGGLIQTNTITSRQMVADSITARELAVGAVTAETLAISSSANSIWNPSCVLGTDGWMTGGSVAVTPGFALAGFTLAGEGCGYVTCASLATGQAVFTYWQPQAASAGVAVEPGAWVEAQARVGAHRCSAYPVIQFFDAGGAYITGADLTAPPQRGLAGGAGLASYHLLWVKGQAPAGAAMARFALFGINDGAAGMAQVGAQAAGQSPYLIWTRAQLGASSPVPMALSQPQAWVPGGVTSISGGVIQTGTVLTRTLAANSITAAKLAVGNSSNVITNSCLAVSTEGWSLGNAGGITAVLGTCAAVHTDYATPDGCGAVDHATSAVGQYCDIAWQAVACIPGDTLEAQVLVLPIAISASLYLDWLDAAGAHLAYAGPTASVPPQAVPAVRGGLAAFVPLQLIALAPAGAARVRLVLRLTSTGVGASAGYTIFTRALLGTTYAGATQASPWAPGGITSIGGGVIRSESIVGRNIQGGSIGAEKLTVASPGNVIWNSTCPSSAAGWINASSVAATIGSVTGDALLGIGYALAGLGSGCLISSATLAVGNAQGLYAAWDPDLTNGVPVQPGEWWEGSALLGAIRCWARVRLQFLAADGTPVGGGAYDAGGSRVAGPTGGAGVTQYGLSWCKGQVPAGAARVRLVLDGLNDGGGDIATGGGTVGQSPVLIWTKAVLAPTVPNASQPQPWTPGGVTQISGGMLKTGSVTARSIGAGEITAEKLSVGSASNVISNSCCATGTFGWSYGVQAWQQSDTYCLTGYGTGYAALTSLAQDATADYSWAPLGTAYNPDGRGVVPWGAATPCNGGELWEAQALVQTHRCSVELYLLFLAQDANGAWNLISAPSTGAQSFAPPAFGRAESNYQQIVIKGVCPPGATLVTLLMRMGNTATSRAAQVNSGQSPYLMFTKVALGLGLPNVPRMPWGPGGRVTIEGGEIRAASVSTLQLAAGSVTAGTIAAGAVTTGALAAGSVTAEKLTIGSPSNMIWNSCPDQGPYGWNRFANGAVPAVGAPGCAVDAASVVNATWGLIGLGSGFAQYLGSGPIYPNQGYTWEWSPTGGQVGVPAIAGHTYGAAALVIAGGGGRVRLQMIFRDYQGALLVSPVSPDVLDQSRPDGLYEGNYTRVEVSGVAPANTASVSLQIVMAGPPGGAQSPFMSFTKAQLGEIATGAKVGPWQPGGLTTISGNMIKTGSLDASRIVAGSITAGQLQAGSVTATQLAANAVTAYSILANSISADRLAANSITAGQIQAAAIGADQLAANQIFARHLAADQILTSSAQIGVGTIQSANIADLTVDNAKIKNLTLDGQKMLPYAVTEVGHDQAIGDSQTKTLRAIVNTSAYQTAVMIQFRAYLPPIISNAQGGAGEGSGGGSG